MQLQMDTKLSIALQLANALHYMHMRTPQAIHYDVKSANVLVRFCYLKVLKVVVYVHTIMNCKISVSKQPISWISQIITTFVDIIYDYSIHV